MMDTPEPSPTSRVERSASLTGCAQPGSLRARPASKISEHPAEIGDPGSVWWSSREKHAGYPPSSNAATAGPQGVAESNFNNRMSPFGTAPSPSLARELSAAVPAPTPSPTRPPVAAPAASSRNVQFAKSPDSIPGEVPATPVAARTATFAETLTMARSSTGTAGAPAAPAGHVSAFGGALTRLGTFHQNAGLAPNSPERPALLMTMGTMKRFHSMRVPQSTRSVMCHLVPLEPAEEVMELPLELTLQHSNRIEKAAAQDLIPLNEAEKPYYYGSRPSGATITRLRGLNDLKRGTFYVPSDVTDAAASGSREVISGTLGWPRDKPILVQLFVLFPSLMRPPRWLRKDFSEVKLASVEVDWDLSSRTRFFLYLTRQLERAERQTLTVWASKKKYCGGESFSLYGAEGTAQLTDRTYVLALKFLERRDGPDPRLMNARDGGALMTRVSGSGGVTGGTGAGALRALSMGPVTVNGTAPGSPGPGMAMGSGGGSGSELFVFGGTSFAVTPGTKTHLELMQEIQQHLLLRAQSTDMPSQIVIPEGGILTWDSVLEHLISAKNAASLRELIDSHLTDHLLRSQELVDRVEKVAITINDPGLMLVLYEHTPVEMDIRTLAFLVHAWATQPLTARAAAAAAAAAARSGASTVSASPFLATGFGSAGDEMLMDDGLEGVDVETGLAARIEEFLVKYVVKRRNPLSTTAAILRAIDDELDQHEDNRRTMRLAHTRFHSLHLALLRRLNRYAEMRHIRLIERILQPVELPNTVNEVSPLQIAFEAQDLKFMTESLVELYVKVQWVGRELLALTAHEDLRGTGATNPLLAYSVLRSLGFAGKGTMDPLVMAGSRLWHVYAFTSTAFFNSPRGRWCMHALHELVFLVLYQWQVMWPQDPRLRRLHLIFLAFIAGNLLDILLFVQYRYGSLARIRKYLEDPWNALSLLVNSVLAVLTCLKLAQDFNAPGLPAYQTADVIHLCMATMAVFVWVRALGMAVPVYPSLGPLLNTVARMMEEVIAFLFPLLIIMTGFATMMAAVYGEFPDTGYNNFINALLQLFSSMLGNFSFDLFDGLSNTLLLYGNIAQVVFLVLSAILLLNLLIAIMNNRYKPQEVEAETQFKKAQVVNYYSTQVSRNLVCSPFCLIQVAIQTVGVLPSGRRNKLSGSAAQLAALGLLPLDGVVLPDDGSDRPTGLAELPHLIFLLTLYPILALITWVLFLAYTPFAMWQFASKQYTHLVKWYRRRTQHRDFVRAKRVKVERRKVQKKGQEAAAGAGETPGSKAGREGAAAGKRQPQGQPSEQSVPNGGGAAVITASDFEPEAEVDADVAAAALTAASTAADGAAGAGGVKAATAASVLLAGSGTARHAGPTPMVLRTSSTVLGYGGGGDAVKPYQRLKKALQANAKQTDLGWGPFLAFALGTTVLGVVGLFAYLTVILLLVLVGWSSLYQWVAKLLFSLFNIFVRPIVDAVRARRRSQRVSPSSAAPSARTLGAKAAGRPQSATGTAGTVASRGSSHIALDVASGAGVTVAAGGAVPGDHGCGGDASCRPEMLSAAAGQGGQDGGAAGGGGRFGRLFGRLRRGVGKAAGGAKAAAVGAAAVAAAAVPLTAADAAEEREVLLQRQRKARLHWQHAIQRVISLKNERYLNRRDVLKAVANSKFRPLMKVYGLSVDPRSSSQDIMDDQLQDLEDDEDPWDDDELQLAGGDEGMAEMTLLEKTDELSSLLKSGINAQSTAMAELSDRLAALAQEVARIAAATGADAPAMTPASHHVALAPARVGAAGSGGSFSWSGYGSGTAGAPAPSSPSRRTPGGPEAGGAHHVRPVASFAVAGGGGGSSGGGGVSRFSPEQGSSARAPRSRMGVHFSGLNDQDDGDGNGDDNVGGGGEGDGDGGGPRLELSWSLPDLDLGILAAPSEGPQAAAAPGNVHWSPSTSTPQDQTGPAAVAMPASPALLPPSPNGESAVAAEPPAPPAPLSGSPGLRPPPNRAPTAYPNIAARDPAAASPDHAPAVGDSTPARRSPSTDRGSSSGGAHKIHAAAAPAATPSPLPAPVGAQKPAPTAAHPHARPVLEAISHIRHGIDVTNSHRVSENPIGTGSVSVGGIGGQRQMVEGSPGTEQPSERPQAREPGVATTTGSGGLSVRSSAGGAYSGADSPKLPGQLPTTRQSASAGPQLAAAKSATAAPAVPAPRLSATAAAAAAAGEAPSPPSGDVAVGSG